MSSSDDEDLQRAIAMSLGQLDGTAEDEAMPSTTANGNTSEAPPRSPADATANTQQPASTRSINESLKRLDRKQLEAERLARQETRKRQLGTPASTPSTQDGERLSKRARTGASAASSQAPQVVDLTTPPRPPKQAATSADRKAGRPQSESSVPTPPASQSQGQAIRNTLQESLGVSIPEQSGNIHVTSSSRPTTEPQYLNGAVKKTWAFGCPRDNDIKLEEVLQNHDLKLLVLSAFNFDTQWWASKIKDTTKQIWILGAENDEQKSEWSLAPAIYNNVEVRFPDLKNGKNHGKLLIGSHPKYLRIVITTANLTQHDWGETGFMENTVFLIDLPRLSEDETTSPDDLTPFGKELCFYLKSLKLGPKGCDSFLRFDWSRTKNLAFVHSLNGAKTGDIGKRTGLPGLSRAIKELGLESNTLEIDYATSSLGALSKGFMKQLLTAAKGENVTVTKEKYDNDVEMGDLLERFRVYFPTLNTVSASKCGVDGGGTITLNRRWYNAPSFPKACMHDHKSTREGLLSHNKIILARGQLRPEDEDDEDATERKNVAWAYIGSHNLTQAAWGSLSTDRSTKSLKVSCRNYECGVIVPVVQENVSDNVEEDEVPRIEVFKEKMDIPFEVPGERYGDRKPWFFEA